MTKIGFIYGYHPVHMALKLYPDKIKQIYFQKSREDERIENLESLANAAGIPIKLLAKSELVELTGSNQHQGFAAECSDTLHFQESMLPDLLGSLQERALLLILDGVQDPHNLGACLRSANAMGVHAVIAPKDRSVGLTSTVRKVACGAAEITPFIQVTNLARTIRMLKEHDVWLVGTAADGDMLMSEVDLTGNIAIVLGGEGKGMRALTKKHCDFIAKIPMHGVIESLNVSVAAGICLYETVRQRFEVSAINSPLL